VVVSKGPADLVKPEWAKALDIELFDPAGITAKRFDDTEAAVSICAQCGSAE
jgi:hypothetical protein